MVDRDPIFAAALGEMDRVAEEVKGVFSAALDEFERTGRLLDADEAGELVKKVEKLGRENEAYGKIARRSWFFAFLRG